MALRSGYKGFKKLLPGLKLFRPGTLGIDNDVLIPELNKTFFPRSEQAVLGAKNRFADVLLTQFTDNAGATHSLSDGLVSVVASATDNSGLFLNQTYTRAAFADIKTPHILSLEMKADSACAVNAAVESTGFLTQSLTTDWVRYSLVIPDPSQMKILYFYNKSGSAQNYYIRKIMLYDANNPDDTYVPYAMTNKELTDEVSSITNTSLTNVTVAPNTVTSLGSFTLKKGKYIVTAIASISKQTSDFDISMSFSSSDSAMGGGRYDTFNGKAPLAANGGIQATKMFNVYSDTTVYVVVEHNHTNDLPLYPAVSIAKV